jgi:hypothetical protein
MHTHHATATHLSPSSHLPLAGDAADAEAAARRTWHPLEGLAIGTLHGMSPGCDTTVTVEAVLDQSADLAVADRVAWVHASRTYRNTVVLATTDGYLIASVSPELDWAAATRLVPTEHAPRIVSVASAYGVLPVLVPVEATV